MNLKASLEEYERELIRSALAASGGHQRRAAAALGLLPTTLNEKLKRLGLRPPRAQEPGLAGSLMPAPVPAGVDVEERTE